MDQKEGENLGGEPWRVWLRRVVGDHGGPGAVSRLAEVPLQTLNNYLHNRSKKPNLDYLRRVADACAVPLDFLEEEAPTASGQPGLAEDVTPWRGALPAMAPRPPVDHGRWTVRSRALELAGILPGDVVEFAMGRAPRDGEPVVAQLYNDAGGAETVLRLYRPPFLMVHSADPAIDPRPIAIDDGDRVKIMGGFVRLVRQANP